MNIDRYDDVTLLAVMLVFTLVWLLSKFMRLMHELHNEIEGLDMQIMRLRIKDEGKEIRNKTHLSNAGIRMLYRRSFVRFKATRRSRSQR